MQEQEYQPVSNKADGKEKDPSLFWVLTKTFGGSFFITGIFKLSSDLLTFASPQILKYVYCSIHIYKLIQMCIRLT